MFVVVIVVVVAWTGGFVDKAEFAFFTLGKMSYSEDIHP